AQQVAGLAMLLYLPHMPADRLPALDLAAVLVRQAAAHVVAAVPLEPAARGVGMNPAVLLPDRPRLAGVDAEEIQRAVAAARRELGAPPPAFRKLAPAIGQVFAAEHAEREHLRRRQIRLELRIEPAPGRRRERVPVMPLHLVADGDG